MEKETINLAGKIVERYMKNGPAKALNLSRKAIVDHAECHIIHRLHAMLVIKNDPSDLSLALKHSNKAVGLYPRSLEYRYFGQILLYNSRKEESNVIKNSVAVWECNNALGTADPMEPCWDLYKQVIDEEAAGVESGETAVEYVKMCFVKLMNSCYRKIDSLPFSEEFLSDMFTPSFSIADPYQTFNVKTGIMAGLIKTEYSSCGFMQRLFSEVCFQYAVRIKDDDEMDDKRKILDLALASAVVAGRVFGSSKDYMINMGARILQCSENLSVVEIEYVKEELRKIRSCSSHEPYCKFLSIQEDITNPRIFGQYYNNCIDLLLYFIQTMEERMNDDVDDQDEFIWTYYRHLYANDLLDFSKQSIFFKRDVQYLLDNVPKLKKNDEDTKKKTAETNPELMKMIAEIVDTNSKKGPSEALKLTQIALENNESSAPAILFRLHSKYIFENDRNDIESALKFAKMAVSLCPDSLEYRFFHASLRYHEASVSSPKDKMLYWMTLLDCEKALGLERVAETDGFEARVIKLIDKKAGEMESAAEIAEYLKNSLRSLGNMCYRGIDDLPKSFFDKITSDSIPPVEKMELTVMMLNSNFRFCPFVYRVHSELCYALEVQTLIAGEYGSRGGLFKTAYISARIAHRNFGASIEYGINMVTRYLQATKNYTRQAAAINRELLSFLYMENNQEPYYKYLVGDNVYTDHEKRKEYFKNCGSLLEAYAKTLELEYDDDCIALSMTEAYFQVLEDYELKEFPEKAPCFFGNIMYLLKNPPRVREVDYFLANESEEYGMMGLLNGKKDGQEEDQRPSQEKKAKKKCKKNKRTSRKK